jgi:hypothetical protein
MPGNNHPEIRDGSKKTEEPLSGLREEKGGDDED